MKTIKTVSKLTMLFAFAAFANTLMPKLWNDKSQWKKNMNDVIILEPEIFSLTISVPYAFGLQVKIITKFAAQKQLKIHEKRRG